MHAQTKALGQRFMYNKTVQTAAAASCVDQGNQHSHIPQCIKETAAI
jgi:hypothetical protein